MSLQVCAVVSSVKPSRLHLLSETRVRETGACRGRAARGGVLHVKYRYEEVVTWDVVLGPPCHVCRTLIRFAPLVGDS